MKSGVEVHADVSRLIRDYDFDDLKETDVHNLADVGWTGGRFYGNWFNKDRKQYKEWEHENPHLDKYKTGLCFASSSGYNYSDYEQRSVVPAAHQYSNNLTFPHFGEKQSLSRCANAVYGYVGERASRENENEELSDE